MKNPGDAGVHGTVSGLNRECVIMNVDIKLLECSSFPACHDNYQKEQTNEHVLKFIANDKLFYLFFTPFIPNTSNTIYAKGGHFCALVFDAHVWT